MMSQKIDTKILKPQPLYKMGYDRIKDFIIAGTLTPGQRLTDNQLAEMLGISRTPVREAVRMLCREGLLNGDDGTVTVYEPTPNDLGEIYSVRATLEGLALSMVIVRGTNADLADELDEIVEVSNKCQLKSNYDKFAELNRRLHDRIIEASESPLIMEQMAAIKTKMHLFRRMSLSQSNHAQISIREHQELVHSLRQGNVLDCRKKLELHILHAGYRMYKDLSQSRGLNGDYKPIGEYLRTMIDIYDQK